jgi:hypothetical protein
MAGSTENLHVARPTLFASVGGIVVLLVPVVVLLAVAARSGQTPLIAGGVATEAFLALGLWHQVGIARASSHKTASPVYLIGVLIVWMSAKDHHDFWLQGGMFIMVGVPLTLFIGQEFLFTGNTGLRRARALVRLLAAKNNWPDDLTACKSIPEVKALREALRDDAEPALVLLTHPKPEVRIAALAAFEFRPSWRMGQAEAVLQAAKYATEPPVRVAAMMALANVDDPNLAALMAIYLRDANPEVRKAAAEALLWDADRRWTLIRRDLRTALANPRCANDGPLPVSTTLPKHAIVDLIIWAGENGAIARRAALTLLAHYRRELNENGSGAVIDELVGRVRDANVISALRVEFAQLLAERECVDVQFWRTLLDAGQPSFLRLLAAGALLREDKDEQALQTLRDVAQVPNREMALQVAAYVQKFLRIDMGLPIGESLPQRQSKLAAEVARRVIDWSSGHFKPLSDDMVLRRTRISSIVQNIPRPISDESQLHE